MTRLHPYDGKGYIRLAFGLFLALGVIVSGWPLLQHLQRQYAMEARATALLNRPLDAEIAQYLLRSRRLSARVGTFHELLEAAESYLWEFRSVRETALILKDVGDDKGELGLRALKSTYPRLIRNLDQLYLTLAKVEREWRTLRENVSAERLREIDRGLKEAAKAASLQEELLRSYGRAAEEAGVIAIQFSRLAPQVVRRVPAAVRDLPGQLEPLREAISLLEDALGNFTQGISQWPAAP